MMPSFQRNPSRITIIDKRQGNESRQVTIIELHDPLPPEHLTCWQVLKGIFIMSFSVLCLTMSGILVKYHYEYNAQVSIYDMVFVRAFAQFLMAYIISIKDKVNLTNLTDYQWRLIIIRSISGTLTFFIFNIAIKLISLSKLAFLNNASPIFAAIIAFLFLGEAISRSELMSLSICIMGVAILVQPYGESSQE